MGKQLEYFLFKKELMVFSHWPIPIPTPTQTHCVGMCGHTIRANFLLPPASKVCKGYVFTPVCKSFCSQGGVPGQELPGQVHPKAGTPMRRYTLSKAGTPTRPITRYTPWAGTPPLGRYTTHQPQCMLGYIQQAGGTHPTGMHSCLNYDHRCVLW